MDKKYIDVEKALVMMRHSKEDKPAYGDWDNAHDCCIDCVNSTPAADVAPVVHGEWMPRKIMSRHPGAKNHYCSVCETIVSETGKYCGNCGAKMDGGK